MPPYDSTPRSARRARRAGNGREHQPLRDEQPLGDDPTDLAVSGGDGSRPLVVTADTGLLDDLLRVCAAAGFEAEVADHARAARRSWRDAPLVLVGADLVDRLVDQGLPRRVGVVLVGLDLDSAQVWAQAVALGAEHVVFLPDAEPWLVQRLGEAMEGGAGDALTVGVLGGRGGAGASTLAAALALTAARVGVPSTLVDADPLGGGIDMLLGGEDCAGLRWPDLASTRGRLSLAALRQALPRLDGLTVLSWDRGDRLVVPPAALEAVLDAARRGGGLVVVDLPRRLDEAAELALTRCDTSLLVVPAEVRATAAAARVAAAVRPLCSDLHVVVRGPAPGGLGADVVADALGLPLAGDLAPEPRIAEAQEAGDPPAAGGRGPLARFCSAFLDARVASGGPRAA